MTASKTKKVELLAPAGDFEKLEIAVHYGADAVYLADKNFSLRNLSKNFTISELQKAVKFAHKSGVKVYVACNIYSRNNEQKEIAHYLEKLGDINPDAVIIADPGIFIQAKNIIPRIPVHLSTQSNTTNYKTALFWENLGVKRINIARELTLKEIKEITGHCKVEIEAFVHGAMCISYSGRCLLSSFMTNRESNRGLCAHPCRWEYSVVEKKRPGEYMPITEDSRGSYVFNSKDLCMIEHIPEMIKSGITSLKIEGRMKGINYLASVVKVYRDAIDSYYENPAGYIIKKSWIDEAAKLSNRGYCTGFYFGGADRVSLNYNNDINSSDHPFVGKVLGKTGSRGIKIEVRNKLFKGDTVEILASKAPVKIDKISDIVDENGNSLEFAQPGSRVTIFINSSCSFNDLLRRI